MIRYPLFRRSLALAFLLVIPSCSRQSSLTTQPDLDSPALRADAGTARSLMPREPGDFFPLAVGNQWTYEFKETNEFLAEDGSVVERMEQVLEQIYSIDCSFPAGGREWFIQRIRHPGGTNVLRALYQDRSGLFGLEELSTADPCASNSVAGRLNIEELRYPLKRGATWAVRQYPNVPPTVVTVEAHEVIETPAGRFPAVRLRVEDPYPRAGETHFAWYGREGLLAIEIRADADFFEPYGRVVRDILSIRLKSVSVAPSRASTAARPGREIALPPR